MLISVKKRTSKKNVDAKLKAAKKAPIINLKKYFGKVDYGMDGLSYQKK
jgi:hypothetical protein